MEAKIVLLRYSDRAPGFKIRLSKGGKKYHQSIEVPFSEMDWNYDPKKRKNELRKRMPSHPEYKTYLSNKKYVDTIEKKYQDVIDSFIRIGKTFTADQVFKAVTNPKKEKPTTLYTVFNQYIDTLKQNQSYGNAANIKSTLGKLKSYLDRDMLFTEIDSEFLLQFRNTMEKQGLSKNTISIHLRNIRTIYNHAIKELGVASLADYPFVNPKVQQGLKSAYKSRALSLEEVNRIRHYRKQLPIGSELWEACNFFLVGYLGRGINFTDIARLRWQDVSSGRVYYIRYKTRSKIEEALSFPITKELEEILLYYQSHDRQLGNPYIFPILNASHTTEAKRHNRIIRQRKILNKSLNELSKILETTIPITTYVWRHTFAAVAKNDMSIDVSMISEMLGHHDLKTTRHYLKNFPDKELDSVTANM